MQKNIEYLILINITHYIIVIHRGNNNQSEQMAKRAKRQESSKANT